MKVFFQSEGNMVTTASIWSLIAIATLFVGTTKSELVTDIKNVNNYALSSDSYPERYHIIFDIYPEHSNDFSVTEYIDIVVTNTTESIVLHAGEMKDIQVILNGSFVEYLDFEYDPGRQFLTMKRKNLETIPAGTKWRLSINYKSEYNKKNFGLFRKSHIDNTGKTQYFVGTNSLNMHAHLVFPCYDKLMEGVNFTITINHSPISSAVSDMPIYATTYSRGKTVFQAEQTIPPGFISFIISDFNYTRYNFNGTNHWIFYRSNAEIVPDFIVKASKSFTEFFTNYFGMDLKSPDVVHVALPALMEEDTRIANLALYTENSLLYNPQHHNILLKTIIELNVAYKIAQKWFGHYVTTEKESEMGLIDGVANLFAYKALSHKYPEQDVMQIYHSLVYQRTLDGENGGTNETMNALAKAPFGINDLYNTIPKSKAASIWFMWHHALTENVFLKATQLILKLNKYGKVSEEKLIAAFEATLDEPEHDLPAGIDVMLMRWFSKKGYPLLNVTRNYKDGSFVITQEVFNIYGPERDIKIWHIPINYAFASSPDFENTTVTHYLLTKKIKIRGKIRKADWLILNKQSFGVFRVNYDEQNWKLITEALIENPTTIHVRNRAQILDDAFALTQSGHLNHSVLLRLLTYLRKENEIAPWVSASKIFEVLSMKLSVKPQDFKLFVKEIVTPAYIKLSWDHIPAEEDNDQHTRILVTNLACWAGVLECIQTESENLENVLNNIAIFATEISGPIFCKSLEHYIDDVYNKILEKLMASEDKDLRKSLIASLGCSQNETLIRSFIHNSIDESNNFSPEERRMLLRSVYKGSDIGFSACVQFLNENWETYGKLTKNLENDILDMSKYVITVNNEQLLRNDLLYKLDLSRKISKSFINDINNQLEHNIEWTDKHGVPIMRWVSEYLKQIKCDDN